MGRPTALTPQTQERILSLLRLGNYIDVACKAAGIHKDTFYEWMKRGRSGKAADERHAAFAVEVDSALAQAEARDVQTILMASQATWQAAAWRLERRFPERWSRSDRVRVDANVEVGVSDDGLLGKLARLLTGATTPEDPGGSDQGGTPAG
jgi:transposase